MRYLLGKQQQRKPLSKPSLIAVLAGMAIGSAVPALAQGSDNHWYFVPQFGVVIGDSERDTDNGVSAAFSVGRTLTRVFSVEARAHTYSMGADNRDRDTDQSGVGIDTLWHPFGRTDYVQSFAPFVLAGVGYVNTDIGDNFDSSNATLSLGVGSALRLGQSAISLRGEGRYVFDFVDADDADTFNDWQASLGLEIALNRNDNEKDPAASQPRNRAQDSDGDGIADFEDFCPASRAAATVDPRGCAIKRQQLADNKRVVAQPPARKIAEPTPKKADTVVWPPQINKPSSPAPKPAPAVAQTTPISNDPIIASPFSVQPLNYERAAPVQLALAKPTTAKSTMSITNRSSTTSTRTNTPERPRKGFTEPLTQPTTQPSFTGTSASKPFTDIVIKPDTVSQRPLVKQQPTSAAPRGAPRARGRAPPGSPARAGGRPRR